MPDLNEQASEDTGSPAAENTWATAAPPPVAERDPAVVNLEKSVRRHRIWLVIITVLVSLMMLACCAVVGLVTFGFGLINRTENSVTKQMIDQTKTAINEAYGSRVQNLQVRSVKVKYFAIPSPLSFGDNGASDSLYVQYNLDGSSVTFADIMGSGPFGEDIAASGMLPTKGTLASRMTLEQLDRFLAAYAAETKAPLSQVHRYTDNTFPIGPDSKSSETITIGNVEYPAKELWSAIEGRVIKGDEIDLSASPNDARNALVFHEDPKTGAFTFLGTEPAQGM